MRHSPWFLLITAVFVTCLITANIIAVKLVNIFCGISTTPGCISIWGRVSSGDGLLKSPPGMPSAAAMWAAFYSDVAGHHLHAIKRVDR